MENIIRSRKTRPFHQRINRTIENTICKCWYCHLKMLDTSEGRKAKFRAKQDVICRNMRNSRLSYRVWRKIIDPPCLPYYGHYDVQPADPIELWTPPFEPVIKNWITPEGRIFARGACDDKGQMYMHVKAFEYMIQNNNLPCNVKFMIEGEKK
jgi:acetylornithine deacetylase/succinyl-diaminopimelate desuccinylase-like protein